MSYFICKQGNIPLMDTLPVYKIINYPLEKNDYKPFAQTKICLCPTKLVIEMLSFEMFPKDESTVKAVIYNPLTDKFIDINADANKNFFVKDNLNNDINSTLRYIKGEDLQGVYWGVVAEIDINTLIRALDMDSIKANDKLLCNFYKISENIEKHHIGSMYPITYKNKTDIYQKDNLAEFTVINYGNTDNC